MDKTELTKLLHKKYHRLFRNAMASRSFKRYKSNDYMRVTSDDIVQRINIQKHSWDTEFTFNITIFPLFFKSEHMLHAFGGIRAGDFINGTDIWWKYANENQIDSSLQDCLKLFESKIFPFYNKILTSEGLFDYLNSTENLFRSYKFHPKDHSNHIGLLIARTGDFENAIKLIDKDILNEIANYKSFDDYLSKIIQIGYEKFKIDTEKYKLHTVNT